MDSMFVEILPFLLQAEEGFVEVEIIPWMSIHESDQQTPFGCNELREIQMLLVNGEEKMLGLRHFEEDAESTLVGVYRLLRDIDYDISQILFVIKREFFW
jgi:hypothetical protein